MSLVRISTKTLNDGLQVIDVDEACLLSIKHVEYATEVFNLLLRVLLKYIIAFLLLVNVHICLSNRFISFQSSYVIIVIMSIIISIISSISMVCLVLIIIMSIIIGLFMSFTLIVGIY